MYIYIKYQRNIELKSEYIIETDINLDTHASYDTYFS